MNLEGHKHSVHNIYYAADTDLSALFAFFFNFSNDITELYEMGMTVTSISQAQRNRGVEHLALIIQLLHSKA